MLTSYMAFEKVRKNIYQGLICKNMLVYFCFYIIKMT